MEDLESKECTFKPAVLSSRKKTEGNESLVSNMQKNSASKWDELYNQAGRKQGKVDRKADEIEFERNQQEMRFAPEVHEINHFGTKKPKIKSPLSKKAAAGLRSRMQEKLNFLNVGQNGTLADSQMQPGFESRDDQLLQGNLEVGTSFED